ncbi:DNA helicase/exodeoxyribonuclease V, gamma subunit [Microlunatus sagamiharensis]|uniref:RecBCD enzyme subunit RecC n=1 Tax=Microlunatus sagamiharensis TaxID=546874 RepID=A0A1H2MCD9_9ACTN|nr:exodeoxyribonuclease V subunit gamma [Microlunatus sagamiharensis]SDU90705.1 DNA helicase/exodeoxyribonuclease V, gamma subunit [Microlunatus sagamiharensis]
MSLHLHRAERADVLVDALGEVLSVPLGDPFASEVVCVPTPGVERWIAQRLAHRLGASAGDDGVCSGVDFPSPRRLVQVALGDPGGDDPWAPGRAVWPLLAAIEEAVAEPWGAVLAGYLGGPGTDVPPDADPWDVDPRRSRRWSTARHLSRLFARYAADRPGMLAAWAAGRDDGPDGAALPPDRAWQPELWRRLRVRIGGPDPVESLRQGLERLRADAAAVDLPVRLSVFGATRLDPRHLDVLVALAVHRDVHLWLPHASPAAWDAVAAKVPPVGPLLPRRTDDPTASVVRHPLLGYLGRDARELQVRLAQAAASAGVAVDDLHHGAHDARAAAPTTLLHRVQDDLAADRPPAGDHLLAGSDTSVQVHACAGPHRQVEVLREVLVGLLADDPDLQPRDVVVMCPDVEAYAPLVAAAFGLDDGEPGGHGSGPAGVEDAGRSRAEHPGHRLRVRLADRSLRQLNPVLAVVTRLLELADGRLTRSALLDLAAAPPVATRFRLGEDDLERLHELVPQTGVRWGLDAAHRARFGMDGFGQNTWDAGLDRLLLGVAMDESEGRFIGTVLPLDDVASDDVELVGRLAELLARVRGLVDVCLTPKSLPDWLALCREVVDLLTDVRPADRWQHAHAYAELARLGDRAGTTAASSTLSLTEVRTLLGEAFRGRASRSGFRTGTLTVASLLPMRAVPHRVVCLLGLDDGAFPRRVVPDGDDLTADDARVGDPDPRAEDRQLLLDAVTSATSTLVVLYTGTDARTGEELRPAVPVDALLETLDATVRTGPSEPPARARLTTHHPLQPFGTADLARGPQGRSFSFDRGALRAAEALRGPHTPARGPYEGLVLAPVARQRDVELSELYRFFSHPVRGLLRARAQLFDGDGDGPEDEQIPVELDGLQRWAVGERMLQAHLSGVPLDALEAAEWRRGEVPPRALGQRLVRKLSEDVTSVAQAATPWLGVPAERLDLVVDLDEVRLSGSVAGVRDQTAVRVVFSRPSARHRLQAWVELLALTLARPGREWRSVVVGRGSTIELGPVPEDFARAVLGDLLVLQAVGLAEVLPFAPRTSFEYARVRARGADWQEGYGVRDAWQQERDALWERVLGPSPEVEDLMRLEVPAAAQRRLPGETTTFGAVARRVFQPLVNAGGG